MIGKALGISRSAVLGKLNREGVLGISAGERSRRLHEGMRHADPAWDADRRREQRERMRLYWAKVHAGIIDRRIIP